MLDPIEHVLYRATRAADCQELGRRLKEAYWAVTGQEEKLSVFLTFGAPSVQASEFKMFMSRHYPCS